MTVPAGREAPPRRRRVSRFLITVLVLAISGGGTWAYLKYVVDAESELPGVNDVAQPDAQQQATLVDQEDLRVMQTRAVLASTLAQGGPRATQVRQPHISSSANGRTLVLTQRSKPYYVADLERYGQKDFQRQHDGSYQQSINIFVADGAKLVLQNATGPLTIRMRSIPGSFTSIVGFGASIRINGSAQNPVRIMSWNHRTNTPDTQVADGRSYIRAIGGDLKMSYTQVEQLGFWSGRTGGVALTGSDRPSDLAERLRAGSRSAKGQVLLPSGRTETTQGGNEEVEVTAATGKDEAIFQVPEANLVTGFIQDSTITGNAYGIFISGSNETRIVNTRVHDSLVHGVLMHRFARNASIENTTVTGSRGDGFVLSRATQNVRISGSVAEGNGGNGFTLSGLPLAEGPSASGESLKSFGNSSVISSTARDNGRYGVELQGGHNLAVQTSQIIGGEMGIVASERATGVQISGNRVVDQRSQGVTLRDGVRTAQLSGNIVRNTQTAIYLRDSSATITGNTVQSASLHAVTLIGTTAGTRISANTLGGAGRSAIDAGRAQGSSVVTGNNTDAWRETAGFWTMVKRIAKPMNLVWAGVFLLVIVSAIRSRDGKGMRIGHRFVHPYEQQRLLEERPAEALRPRSAEPVGAHARASRGADG